MPIVVELWAHDGTVVRRTPDPSRGTYDAAGDFDRLLDDDSYRAFSQVDPYGVTTLGSAAMPALLADISAALAEAKPGAETRGLLRLRGLAERCRDDSDLRLVFLGD